MAFGLRGERMTLVLGSRDEQETGRIVTFAGPKLLAASSAPALDPDLLALVGDVLVVQEQAHLGLTDEHLPGAKDSRPVLAGYSITDVRVEPADAERSNADHVRRLIAPLGKRSQDGGATLDASALAELQAIPQWEEHLAALFLDRSVSAQDGAFAVARQLHSPALRQALLRQLRPTPQRLPSPWSREPGWWYSVLSKAHQARFRAAVILVELRHVPAIKPLTKLFLEAPIGDHHEPLAGREFPQAFCSWIGGSELPEAKAAIQDYDRFFDAPGAWAARCHDLLPQPPRER
jgi:hypothetical protein